MDGNGASGGTGEEYSGEKTKLRGPVRPFSAAFEVLGPKSAADSARFSGKIRGAWDVYFGRSTEPNLAVKDHGDVHEWTASLLGGTELDSGFHFLGGLGYLHANPTGPVQAGDLAKFKEHGTSKGARFTLDAGWCSSSTGFAVCFDFEGFLSQYIDSWNTGDDKTSGLSLKGLSPDDHLGWLLTAGGRFLWPGEKEPKKGE